MATTTWNLGDPLNYVEIVTQATAVARGGAVKNFFNIFTWRRTTTVNPLVKSAISTAFATAIETPLLAAVNIDYTQTFTTVRFFEDPTDPVTQFTRSGVGAISGVRCPDFNAVVVQLKTGVRGKPGRGSKHFGPIAISQLVGDDLTSGAITLWSAVGAAIVAGFTDGQGNVWVPGLRAAARFPYPYNYKLPLPTVTGWTDITSYTLNKSLGTMRRRKIRTVT